MAIAQYSCIPPRNRVAERWSHIRLRSLDAVVSRISEKEETWALTRKGATACPIVFRCTANSLDQKLRTMLGKATPSIQWLYRAALLMPFAAGTANAASDSDHALQIGGYTVANVLRGKKGHAAFVEYRMASHWSGLRGWATMGVVTHDSYFIGAGAYYGIPVHQHWEFGLAFGPGLVRGVLRNELGSALEFRSSAEVSLKLRNAHRISFSFGHVSNGGFGHINPGSEYLRLGWQVPIGLSHSQQTEHD